MINFTLFTISISFKLVNVLNLTKNTVKFEHCVRICCHFDSAIFLFKSNKKKFQMLKRKKRMEGLDVTFVVTPNIVLYV